MGMFFKKPTISAEKAYDLACIYKPSQGIKVRNAIREVTWTRDHKMKHVKAGRK